MSSHSVSGEPLLTHQPSGPSSPQETGPQANPFAELPDELFLRIASELSYLNGSNTLGAIDDLMALRAVNRRWRRILTRAEVSKLSVEPLKAVDKRTKPISKVERRYVLDLIQTDRWAKEKFPDGVYHWESTFRSSIGRKAGYIDLLHRALNLPLPSLQEAIREHKRLHCPIYCGGIPLLVAGLASSLLRLTACQDNGQFPCEVQKPIQALTLSFGIPLSIATIFSIRKKRMLATKLENANSGLTQCAYSPHLHREKP